MAIYHLTLKTGSALKGQSALAKSNYIKREGKYLNRENDDQVLIKNDLFMPSWAETGADFWRAADKYERANARIFKELEFALPRELTFKQQKKLVTEFIKINFKHQHPMSAAIHAGKGSNPHCHLMFSERINDGNSRTEKSFFKRANRKDPQKGGALKADCSKKWWLNKTRENWAHCVNLSLEKANSLERVSHLSLEAQGVDRIPQMHYGAKLHHNYKKRVTELGLGTLNRLEELKLINSPRFIKASQRDKSIKEAEVIELEIESLEKEKETLKFKLEKERDKPRFPSWPEFPSRPQVGFGSEMAKSLVLCVSDTLHYQELPEKSRRQVLLNLRSFSLSHVDSHNVLVMKDILEKSRDFFEACPFDSSDIVRALDRSLKIDGPEISKAFTEVS